MVHCKQARRKPGGPGTPGGRARAGGGASAVPAPSAPGYMRPTSSSGARAGQEVASAAAVASAPAAPPVGSKAVVFGASTPRAARQTCSSAQKSARGGGCGGEGHRACRYAYCSFKGHAPAAPPLGAFLAARRGLIKTEQSMKHRGVSAFRNPRTNPTNVAGKGDGFFVHVVCPGAGARPKTASSGSCCSGLSAEEVEPPYVNFDRRSCRDNDKWADPPGSSVDGSCGSSDVISDGFADLPGRTSSPSPGRKDEIGQEEGKDSWVDQEEAEEEEEDSVACCRSDISEELGARYECNNMSKDCGGSSVESSMDDISGAFGVMNFQDAGADAAATSQGNKLTMSRRRTPRGGERIRAFNPRAPNFLPVVPDPDAEKVDLRHQMTDDRKNAEEWMVDYALRRTVNKLARAQKRKVEMLVQAFETVLPPVLGAKKSDDKKSFACN